MADCYLMHPLLCGLGIEDSVAGHGSCVLMGFFLRKISRVAAMRPINTYFYEKCISIPDSVEDLTGTLTIIDMPLGNGGPRSERGTECGAGGEMRNLAWNINKLISECRFPVHSDHINLVTTCIRPNRFTENDKSKSREDSSSFSE